MAEYPRTRSHTIGGLRVIFKSFSFREGERTFDYDLLEQDSPDFKVVAVAIQFAMAILISSCKTLAAIFSSGL